MNYYTNITVNETVLKSLKKIFPSLISELRQELSTNRSDSPRRAQSTFPPQEQNRQEIHSNEGNFEYYEVGDDDNNHYKPRDAEIVDDNCYKLPSSAIITSNYVQWDDYFYPHSGTNPIIHYFVQGNQQMFKPLKHNTLIDDLINASTNIQASSITSSKSSLFEQVKAPLSRKLVDLPWQAGDDGTHKVKSVRISPQLKAIVSDGIIQTPVPKSSSIFSLVSDEPEGIISFASGPKLNDDCHVLHSVLNGLTYPTTIEARNRDFEARTHLNDMLKALEATNVTVKLLELLPKLKTAKDHSNTFTRQMDQIRNFLSTTTSNTLSVPVRKALDQAIYARQKLRYEATHAIRPQAIHYLLYEGNILSQSLFSPESVEEARKMATPLIGTSNLKKILMKFDIN